MNGNLATMDRLPSPLLDRLDEFTEAFRAVFLRQDQFARFQTYLRGLLTPSDRKNVEAIASAVGRPGADDLTQALQHFVSHSPWDADRLLAIYRAVLPPDPQAVWVVHDGVFPKKGRHSVGAQRQYARSAGRKLACQVAVVVGRVGPVGYFPLAARLYLPAQWLRENSMTAARTIPAEHRQPASKAEIALRLVDRLSTEGGSPLALVAAEEAYSTSHRFADELALRGLQLTTATAAVEEALDKFGGLKTDLGIDHFEGRSWTGWHHHASLVFVAHAYRSGIS